jgi:sulfur carrier protein
MIKVSLNGEELVVEDGLSLSEFIKLYSFDGSLGVAINMEFISKDSYETTLIKDGDKIDILAPVCGG